MTRPLFAIVVWRSRWPLQDGLGWRLGLRRGSLESGLGLHGGRADRE